jgi:hypothetical protein
MMAESDDDSDFVSIVNNTIRPPPQNDITICYSSEEDVDDDVADVGSLIVFGVQLMYPVIDF